MMIDPSVKFEIDASLQELSIGNQKCDNADAAAEGDMIPMCRPCFAGNTKKDAEGLVLVLFKH